MSSVGLSWVRIQEGCKGTYTVLESRLGARQWRSRPFLGAKVELGQTAVDRLGLVILRSGSKAVAPLQTGTIAGTLQLLQPAVRASKCEGDP